MRYHILLRLLGDKLDKNGQVVAPPGYWAASLTGVDEWAEAQFKGLTGEERKYAAVEVWEIKRVLVREIKAQD